MATHISIYLFSILSISANFSALSVYTFFQVIDAEVNFVET